MNIMTGMLEGFGGGDVPWLSEDPITGTIDADSMQAIDVVFDSSVLTQTGWYNGELKVSSDDPINRSIVIPVDMVVVSGTPGVALSADSTLVSSPGMQVTHTFTVTNTSDVIDIYDLALSGNAWDSTASATDTSFVNPGETFTFTAVVDIPTAPSRDAIVGTDVFTVTATSQLDGSYALATGTTMANVATGVSLSGDQAATDMGGTVVTYTLSVTNTGEYTDTVALSASGTWSPSLSAASVMLGAGESASFEAYVAIPANAGGGDFDTATVTATSQLDPMSTASANLTTTAVVVYGVELSGDAALSGEVGTTVTYTLSVTNTGNVTDTFTIAVSDVWGASAPASIMLGAGATGTFDVAVTVPAGAADGDFDTATVTVISDSDVAATDSADLTTTATVTVEPSGDIFLPLIFKP